MPKVRSKCCATRRKVPTRFPGTAEFTNRKDEQRARRKTRVLFAQGVGPVPMIVWTGAIHLAGTLGAFFNPAPKHGYAGRGL